MTPDSVFPPSLSPSLLLLLLGIIGDVSMLMH